jgi:hypothetical protein
MSFEAVFIRCKINAGSFAAYSQAVHETLSPGDILDFELSDTTGLVAADVDWLLIGAPEDSQIGSGMFPRLLANDSLTLSGVVVDDDLTPTAFPRHGICLVRAVLKGGLGMAGGAEKNFLFGRSTEVAVPSPSGGTTKTQIPAPGEQRELGDQGWGKRLQRWLRLILRLTPATKGGLIAGKGGAGSPVEELPVGVDGKLLTADSSAVTGLSWQDATDASAVVTPGWNTSAMSTGLCGYVSGADVVSPTDATSLSSAIFAGVYAGTPGKMVEAGRTYIAVTTASGMPANDDPLYLALATDDGGTAAGKVSKTPPLVAGQWVAPVAICRNNAQYGVDGTVLVVIARDSRLGL